MTFKIEFDYRFDESNFFTNKRKAVLEYAGDIWSSYIRDNFKTIQKDEILDFRIGNAWKNVTLDKSIDDLLIFVSASEIDSGTLAQAAPEASGNYVDGSDRDQRFEGKDFEPWVGTIEFNSSLTDEFYFDPTPKTDDVPFEQYDFLSVSIHEIGHVLGIGTSNSFYDQVENGEFIGSQSVKLNNGKPIPLNLWQDHIEEDFSLDLHSHASLDPSIFAGERVLPTRLDLAILKDIGYEISSRDLAVKTPQEEDGFSIKFDYRFDKSNFFTSEKKAVLEYAADIWSSHIQDEFTAIGSGTFNVYDLDGKPRKIILDDSIDDLLIFPSAKDLSSIGQGDFLSAYFENTYLEQRLEGEDFEPWMGMIEFDSSTKNEFYFDPTPETDDVPLDKYDFLTVSLREIGRVLGVGNSSSFNEQIKNGKFVGSQSVELNNGKRIPLDDDELYVEDGFNIDADSETLFDESIPKGERNLPSRLDLAILQDIGYEIAEVKLQEETIETEIKYDRVTNINQLSLSDVHRFYQSDRGFHFYTSDTNEIKVVKEKSQNQELPYNYENAKFTVLSDNRNVLTGELLEDIKPVYRFYNTSTGAHIYTMDRNEKAYIQRNLNNYDFEGIKYYAFESEPEDMETVPLYRMLNGMSGTHLFTVDQNEINYIQENLPHFSVEGNSGVAFHVFEL